jgi:thymidylate kinase
MRSLMTLTEKQMSEGTVREAMVDPDSGAWTPRSGPPAPWLVVTGLDGAGKSLLVRWLATRCGAHAFRLPYHDFVKPALRQSGRGAPWGDVLTDRLLFATDARLTNYHIRQWRTTHPLLVSQRGWMDNYIFGAVQGVGYAETDTLLRTAELERPSAIIYLVAEPAVAFARICRDPNGDKYETLQFMRRQYRETLRFYQAVRAGWPILAPFAGIPATLLDTSCESAEAVACRASLFLREVGLTGAGGHASWQVSERQCVHH